MNEGMKVAIHMKNITPAKFYSSYLDGPFDWNQIAVARRAIKIIWPILALNTSGLRWIVLQFRLHNILKAFLHETSYLFSILTSPSVLNSSASYLSLSFRRSLYAARSFCTSSSSRGYFG